MGLSLVLVGSLAFVLGLKLSLDINYPRFRPGRYEGNRRGG